MNKIELCILIVLSNGKRSSADNIRKKVEMGTHNKISLDRRDLYLNIFRLLDTKMIQRASIGDTPTFQITEAGMERVQGIKRLYNANLSTV